MSKLRVITNFLHFSQSNGTVLSWVFFCFVFFKSNNGHVCTQSSTNCASFLRFSPGVQGQTEGWHVAGRRAGGSAFPSAVLYCWSGRNGHPPPESRRKILNRARPSSKQRRPRHPIMPLVNTHIIHEIILKVLILSPDDAHGWVWAVSSKHALLWREEEGEADN